MRPAGGHEVDGLDRAQGDDVGVEAVVADHADRAHRQEDGEGLRDLVVEIRAAQLFDEDVVGLAQGLGIVPAYLAEDAHAEAGAGEGVAVDHLGGQAQLDADAAHFVLEQLAQRLDQPEVHVIRQAADVVV